MKKRSPTSASTALDILEETTLRPKGGKTEKLPELSSVMKELIAKPVLTSLQFIILIYVGTSKIQVTS